MVFSYDFLHFLDQFFFFRIHQNYLVALKTGEKNTEDNER